jgi:hypothetical protein
VAACAAVAQELSNNTPSRGNQHLPHSLDVTTREVERHNLDVATWGWKDTTAMLPLEGGEVIAMAQDGSKQQNTAYGVFVQACGAHHKRQYPDELIHKEIKEFNKQCSVWWYNLS